MAEIYDFQCSKCGMNYRDYAATGTPKPERFVCVNCGAVFIHKKGNKYTFIGYKKGKPLGTGGL